LQLKGAQSRAYSSWLGNLGHGATKNELSDPKKLQEALMLLVLFRIHRINLWLLAALKALSPEYFTPKKIEKRTFRHKPDAKVGGRFDGGPLLSTAVVSISKNPNRENLPRECQQHRIITNSAQRKYEVLLSQLISVSLLSKIQVKFN
jgi:hypothetical protein